MYHMVRVLVWFYVRLYRVCSTKMQLATVCLISFLLFLLLLPAQQNTNALLLKRNKQNHIIYLQNGGGCDQKPVSVQTMLASPTSKCPSLQLNVTKAPTAYFRWLADTLVPSIRPFIGTSGVAH